MSATAIPAGFEELAAPMRIAHERILTALQTHHLPIESYPDLAQPGHPRGRAAARAYPMQGILKYHGLSDWDWRIAFLPSVSVTNDAGHTLTYVEFDPDLPSDRVVIGGQEARGRDLERVVQSLDVVRQAARVTSRALVVSRNVVRARTAGKGLGSSASASAALAMAAIAALFGADLARNERFLSCMARLLAGSGCRSAAGGVALWLSYPGCPHSESFALRLDRQNELADLRLITVPIDSRIGLKTEAAHVDAPHSSFFKSWMQSRASEVLECVQATLAGDWRTLGRYAELDSIRLHGVTMSGSMEQKLFAWEPENITLFRMCNDLRAADVPVYASTDTGPTVVFLTHRQNVGRVVAEIRRRCPELDVIEGNVAGPATLVDADLARHELE